MYAALSGALGGKNNSSSNSSASSSNSGDGNNEDVFSSTQITFFRDLNQTILTISGIIISIIAGLRSMLSFLRKLLYYNKDFA